MFNQTNLLTSHSGSKSSSGLYITTKTSFKRVEYPISRQRAILTGPKETKRHDQIEQTSLKSILFHDFHAHLKIKININL